MNDDYLDDTEFYDGLEDHPHHPYQVPRQPRWLTGDPIEEAVRVA